MRQLYSALFLSFFLLPALASAAEIDRRVEARPGGTVEISNLVGTIEVRGWNESAVEVRGRTSGSAAGVEIKSHGGSVEIEAEAPFGPGSSSADLEIRIPRDSLVRIESLSADIDVAAVTGTIEIETVSGRVRIEGGPRMVEAETVSGNVEIRGEVPALRVSTVSGDLDLTAGRAVEASTVSGRLRLRGVVLERAKLEVVSGEIDFEGELRAGADFSVSSHSGPILLTLPDTLSASFEATTFSGRIRNDLGPPARSKNPHPSEMELEFTLGQGAARVRLESFSGKIEIRRR